MLRKTLLGRQVSFSLETSARNRLWSIWSETRAIAAKSSRCSGDAMSNNDSNEEQQSLQVTTCLIDNRQLAGNSFPNNRSSITRGIIILRVRSRGKSRVSKSIEINRYPYSTLSLTHSFPAIRKNSRSNMRHWRAARSLISRTLCARLSPLGVCLSGTGLSRTHVLVTRHEEKYSRQPRISDFPVGRNRTDDRRVTSGRTARKSAPMSDFSCQDHDSSSHVCRAI